MSTAVTHCIEHAVAEHHLAVVRNKHASPVEFRRSITQLATIVGVEATKGLGLQIVNVETPIQMTEAQRIADRVALVPVLRAGIGMVQPMLDLIPEAEVWHLGVYRDESTAKPVHYYSKLPQGRPADTVLILDPMLATGGSAAMTCEAILEWGVENIKMLSIIAAPEGIEKLSTEFPQVEIYTCAVDERLNDQKYIVPGLGDAGDRVFNT